MSAHDDGSAPADPPDSQALERLRFLARAGEVLAASLDYEQTLQEVAHLAVPTLGDLCIVEVVEDSALRRVATAHVRPEKVSLLDALRARYPTSADSPQPAGRVIRSGEPELLAVVTPEVVAAHTRDRAHAQLIRDIGIRSHIAVPLIARGATIGAISIGITESDRRYGPSDVSLVQDLARRAAVAVDNARLYQAARHELAERRRAEEAARVSEARFRALVEQSPLSTQILAPSGRTLQVNRAWEALWGLTLERLGDYDILADPQLDAAGITPLLRRAFAGEAVDLPAIRYDPNQTTADWSRRTDPARWVRAFAYPVKDAQGAVREVVLVHVDVTEARRADEQLRVSEGRLQLALAAGRMNVWDWDLATDVVTCSENARAFWGIDIGQAADFIAVIHPEDAHRVADAARAALAGEAFVADYRLAPRDAPARWVHSRGVVERGTDGGPRRILGVTVDITEIKRAEETTRLLADAGETLGSSLDYEVTLRDLARVVVPRVADWCAVDLIDESQELRRVVVHHTDPARVALAHELFTRYPPLRTDGYGAWRVIETQEPEWAEAITTDQLAAGARDAEHFELLRSLSLRSYIGVPLVARGRTLGVLTLVYAESGRRYSAEDVSLATELARRAATAVDNATLYQRLRLEDRRKDEFLATLAHELRNPLAPIRTGLTLLRVGPDADTAERTRQIMERQLAHMVRLIDDLLDVSRVTRGAIPLARERVDLWSIVGTALEASRPVLDAAGVQLVVRLPESPIVLDADRTRLAQVVSNLLNNAAKFTDSGGRVELGAAEDGRDVIVTVRDTGIGIPREMLAQVFEMFSQVDQARTRAHGGLGIGLTLVKHLVTLHGGEVWAESAGPGAGSCFTVRLPRATSAPAVVRAAAATPSRPRTTTARRILVVDDNADAAEMLAALLAVDGHEVRVATGGADALAAAADFRPDVGFLDIGLPGLSGHELARRLRAQPSLAGITLVAVTGWGQAEDRRQSQLAGFDHHLTKPVDPREIQAILDAREGDPGGDGERRRN